MRLVRLPRRPCSYSFRRVCRHVGSWGDIHTLVSSGQVCSGGPRTSSPSLLPVLIPLSQEQGLGGGTGLFLTKLRLGSVIHTALSPHPLQTNLTCPHHSAQATPSRHSHVPMVWYLKRVPAPRKGDRWSSHPLGGRGWGACANLLCEHSCS